jgi:hypothetical protein
LLHDRTRPDSARSDSAQPDSARSDSARSDSAQPDSAQPDSARSDSAQPDPTRSDSAQPDPTRSDSMRAGAFSDRTSRGTAVWYSNAPAFPRALVPLSAHIRAQRSLGDRHAPSSQRGGQGFESPQLHR